MCIHTHTPAHWHVHTRPDTNRRTGTHRHALTLRAQVLDRKAPCVGFCEQPKVLPCTHNMVSTVHFKGSQPKIDLAFIANSTRYSTYDRKRFAAITIRITNPKVTALLFSSGKLVVTGAVSRQMYVHRQSSGRAKTQCLCVLCQCKHTDSK